MDNNQLNNAFIISEILKRYAQGVVLDEHEAAILENWKEQNKHNKKVLSQLKEPKKVARSLYSLGQTDTEQQLDQLLDRIARRSRFRQLYKVASVAAITLLISSAAFYGLYYSSKQSPKDPQELVSAYGDDVLPASNKATIRLSSGATFVLREDEQGIVLSENEISYLDGKSIGDVSTAQYATLATPRGGQYEITLSDGSKVSLNAGSSLEYPLSFIGNERIVKLHGEAYFEISRNEAKPFIVQTENQQIKVLGTIFNVDAYSTRETTTLLSGKVLVKDLVQQREVQLLPNTQAEIYKGNINTKTVDATDYIGWKTGKFQGDQIKLQNIAEEIERWYDVDFVYPQGFKNEETALIIIKRDEKLSAVLKTLETTYGVHFQIKGKEVHVN